MKEETVLAAEDGFRRLRLKGFGLLIWDAVEKSTGNSICSRGLHPARIRDCFIFSEKFDLMNSAEKLFAAMNLKMPSLYWTETIIEK